MNANRARSLRLVDGPICWVSEDISPPPHESLRINQIAVKDVDGDGAPLYQRRWQGESLCANLATWRSEEGHEVLVGVGTPSGSEGRFSLEKGNPMVLYVVSFPYR